MRSEIRGEFYAGVVKRLEHFLRVGCVESLASPADPFFFANTPERRFFLCWDLFPSVRVVFFYLGIRGGKGFPLARVALTTSVVSLHTAPTAR